MKNYKRMEYFPDYKYDKPRMIVDCNIPGVENFINENKKTLKLPISEIAITTMLYMQMASSSSW